MLHLSPGLTAYLLCLAALLGLVLGSFAGCMAARIADGTSFLTGRSRCADCGHTLAPLDLIPVLSWLALKGKCRYCGASIPASCPVTELLSAAAFMALLWRYDVTLLTLEYWVLTVLLLAIALVDWDTGLIPDGLLLAGIVNFVLFSVLRGGGQILSRLLWGLGGGLALAVPLLALVLVMDRVLQTESMGGGDLKLFFVVGLYLSRWELLYLLLVSCLLGLALALLTGKTTEDPEHPKAIPFGPAICAGTLCAFLTGESVVTWYLSLF